MEVGWGLDRASEKGGHNAHSCFDRHIFSLQKILSKYKCYSLFIVVYELRPVAARRWFRYLYEHEVHIGYEVGRL